MAVARSLRLGVWAALACSSTTLRTVPTGPHPSDAESVPVDYPPPPAKVEEVGNSPDPDCAWRDGYWDFIGRQWEWVPGAWVVPPAGCFYAPRVRMGWTPKGVLEYGKPRWYRSDRHTTACPEPPACTAETAR
jgi:hypothetical protein